MEVGGYVDWNPVSRNPVWNYLLSELLHLGEEVIWSGKITNNISPIERDVSLFSKQE